MKQFYIYIITNLINNKQYIGQHYGELNDAYYGSGTNIIKAINKYGKENFKKEILEICTDRATADQKEKEYIEKYDCVNSPNFYNLQEGGTGGDGWRATQRYFQEHPDIAQEVYQKNIKNLQEWQKAHPEKVKENIEKCIEGSRQWKKEHPQELQKIMGKVQEGKKQWQQEHYEEWQMQIKDFIKKGAETNSKQVLCITTGKIFPSLSEAARFYNTHQSNITKCLKGQRKTSGKDPETGKPLQWKLLES